MTKADIVNALYEKIGLSKKETANIVEVVLETLKENLEQGRKIKLAGFGNFVVRQKVARKGRNPKTGEDPLGALPSPCHWCRMRSFQVGSVP